MIAAVRRSDNRSENAGSCNTRPNAFPAALEAIEGLLILNLCRSQGILHQHGDGHRADAAGNGRDESRHFLGFIEIDIADQTITALLGRIRFGIHAHVNYCRTGLDPIAAHHLGLADGRNENIGLPHHIREVLGAGMANGHGCIAAHQ